MNLSEVGDPDSEWVSGVQDLQQSGNLYLVGHHDWGALKRQEQGRLGALYQTSQRVPQQPCQVAYNHPAPGELIPLASVSLCTQSGKRVHVGPNPDCTTVTVEINYLCPLYTMQHDLCIHKTNQTLREHTGLRKAAVNIPVPCGW